MPAHGNLFVLGTLTCRHTRHSSPSNRAIPVVWVVDTGRPRYVAVLSQMAAVAATHMKPYMSSSGAFENELKFAMPDLKFTIHRGGHPRAGMRFCRVMTVCRDDAGASQVRLACSGSRKLRT